MIMTLKIYFRPSSIKTNINKIFNRNKVKRDIIRK